MLYQVLLGIDRAAYDTGRRVILQVREADPLSAALKAEEMTDRKLSQPDVEYSHAMSVTTLAQPTPAAAMVLQMAA